ncbi:MAG: YdeI/OmpD-associated family protein [Myxococcota bacterium]
MRFDFQMRGVVERRSMGTNAKGELFYNVVYLSDEVVSQLPRKGPRLRIKGVFEDHPIELGIQPGKLDPPFIIVSKSLLEQSGALLGDTVKLRFSLVDPDVVAIPEELAAALEKNPSVKGLWQTLSAGKRRSWATYVDRAKRTTTRSAKAKEVVDRVRRGLVDPKDRWP